DLTVDLRRAYAHASRIEHRVRPAVDDEAVVRGQLHVVAVTPDAGKLLEVGGVVARAVGIVPEAYRHRGEGGGTHQLALLAAHRAPEVVVALHLHAEFSALYLAAPPRARRIARGEARDDVGAAGDRGEVHVLLDLAVDVVVALSDERRARRKHGPDRGQ